MGTFAQTKNGWLDKPSPPESPRAGTARRQAALRNSELDVLCPAGLDLSCRLQMWADLRARLGEDELKASVASEAAIAKAGGTVGNHGRTTPMERYADRLLASILGVGVEGEPS